MLGSRLLCRQLRLPATVQMHGHRQQQQQQQYHEITAGRHSLDSLRWLACQLLHCAHLGAAFACSRLLIQCRLPGVQLPRQFLQMCWRRRQRHLCREHLDRLKTGAPAPNASRVGDVDGLATEVSPSSAAGSRSEAGAPASHDHSDFTTTNMQTVELRRKSWAHLHGVQGTCCQTAR